MTSAKKKKVNPPMFTITGALKKRQIEGTRLHFDQWIEEKKRGHDAGENDLENQF